MYFYVFLCAKMLTPGVFIRVNTVDHVTKNVNKREIFIKLDNSNDDQFDFRLVQWNITCHTHNTSGYKIKYDIFQHLSWKHYLLC